MTQPGGKVYSLFASKPPPSLPSAAPDSVEPSASSIPSTLTSQVDQPALLPTPPVKESDPAASSSASAVSGDEDANEDAAMSGEGLLLVGPGLFGAAAFAPPIDPILVERNEPDTHGDDIVFIPASQSQGTSSGSQTKRMKRTKNAIEVIVIPDSPPPKKRGTSSFQPLSTLYSRGKNDRRANTLAQEYARWPTKEEHGGFNITAPPQGTAWRESWNEQTGGTWKGKEKAVSQEEGGDAFELLKSLTTLDEDSFRVLLSKSTLHRPPRLITHPIHSVPSLKPPHRPHPLLDRLFQPFLPSSLHPSSFSRPSSTATDDAKKRDPQHLWTTTYAPQNAAEVLGTTSGKSALVLKEWLSELTLWKDDDKLPGQKKRSNKRPAFLTRGPKPKKRKKNRRAGSDSDEDDWIVDDDDEDDRYSSHHDGDDSDDDFRPRGGDNSRKKLFPSLSNLMLLFGCTGSGKTAAVHACAAELGFSVLELNSSQRRSARDIERLVGDATTNHIVHGSGSPKKDFFGRPRGTPTAAQGNKESASRTTNGTDKARKFSESLILLEEVDNLYGEEKDFWAGVTSLAQRSKRPVILTCNDLSSVPFADLFFQEVNLDGTCTQCLPFAAPEPESAHPYLSALALSEGHIISTPDIKALYDSSRPSSEAAFTGTSIPHPNIAELELQRQPDLRRAVMQLQFDCQWGVTGDATLQKNNGSVEAVQTLWSEGTLRVPYSSKKAPPPSTDATVRLDDALEVCWKAADSLSFADAVLARRPWVQIEVDEQNVLLDPSSHTLGPPQVLPFYDGRNRLQLAQTGREDEYVGAVQDLVENLFGRQVDSKDTEDARYLERCKAVHIADRLMNRLISPPHPFLPLLPLLPNHLIFSDFLPLIRVITAMDIERAKFEDGAEPDSRGGGVRRSTRLSGKSYSPRLSWARDEQHSILASSFPPTTE